MAQKGSIRVPSFQRSYVWTAEDVRKLFDSLYRGFPVGTVLFWQHEAPAGPSDLGPIKVDAEAEEHALWVVDGQQRIISLFASLTSGLREIDDRFDVYFDLAAEKFVTSRRGVPPRRAVPVSEALETRSLLNWLRLHADELEPDDFEAADRLGGALRDYHVPAYVVTSDDQDLLREIFDRVNSAGKPISRAEVFHALFAREDAPGSPAGVVSELESLGFGRVPENRIVQSLLAIRGGNVGRDIREEFGPNEDIADWYNRTERALSRSIKFLQSEGVLHVSLMPDGLPLPVLAAFFYVHPEPSAWNLRLLARWLWRGWANGFGEESGQTPIMRRAIMSVNPARLNTDQAPTEYDAIVSLLARTHDREPATHAIEEFKTNGRNGRLVLLALATLRPRGPNGKEIDLPGLLQKYGTDAVAQFTKRGRTNAGSRGFWPPNAPSITEITDEAILSSHLIDRDSIELLREGDEEGFIDSRSEKLEEVVRGFLSSRVEAGAILRPSLDDLIVIGNAEEAS
ncbi:DUF262 domain-containing protein [Nocardia africana]|uniref:DUF262 domain-containing protein n=1 Tax=Nocardia africana TaxID=134964 RepID=A0ABW6NMR6_9NOCA